MVHTCNFGTELKVYNAQELIILLNILLYARDICVKQRPWCGDGDGSYAIMFGYTRYAYYTYKI